MSGWMEVEVLRMEAALSFKWRTPLLCRGLDDNMLSGTLPKGISNLDELVFL